MPVGDGYDNAYPRAGKVALLCEGDLIGYEASILRRWTDDRVGTNPLVDIWPCGTGHAIYGMSDAIGRSCYVLAIEDRDFRTPAEAESDCQKTLNDRRRREVRVVNWCAWHRNEIENYLLEPEVLYPVMSEAFGCTIQNVEDGVMEILPSLVPFQAMQSVLYRARRIWERSDPSRLLSSRMITRPIWDDAIGQPSPPDPGALRATLQENLARWHDILPPNYGGEGSGERFDALTEFDKQLDLWRDPANDDSWRTDWTGKDILQWLRIRLASHFGVMDGDSRTRVKLNWNLSRTKRDAQDRPIESALKPRLASRFLDYLLGLTNGVLWNEWSALEAFVRGWNTTI
ncbi:MAG TPA: hypothetical protein VGP63_03725 [Planctomycetaceae bacterium]|jgi:hypothetical protein|nr:hypothetical protein [Planctomycetaceae bacterium]